MKKKLCALLFTFALTATATATAAKIVMVPKEDLLPCHPGKYIVGIAGNSNGRPQTSLYLSDTVNGKPNPPLPVPFWVYDTDPSWKVLYSMAQNAMNLHLKTKDMLCARGYIVAFGIVRYDDE